MRDKYVSKRYWKNGATAMGASDEKAKSFSDVIDLSLGDPDLTTPEIIIEKAFEDAKNGHTKYVDFRGDPDLRRAIVEYYKDELNMSIDDKNIMVTAGGCVAMYLVLEAILDDKDEVIYHTPCFTPYPQQIELTRGVPVPFPTFEEEGFQLNIERLENAITERTKAIIVNTPCNPTGMCLTRKTLEDIARIAIEHDLLVIADDIYTLYCFKEAFLPISSLPGMFERTVTINSFSKDYTMTGWRVGNIIAPEKIIRIIQQINENVVFTTPSISQRAALHAIAHRKEVQPPMYEEYKKRVFYAAQRINKIPKLSVIEPEGTFYLFVNIKKTGLTSVEITEKILQEAHVLALPGDTFGASGEGYIRFACTCSMGRLCETFDRIEKMDIFK